VAAPGTIWPFFAFAQKTVTTLARKPPLAIVKNDAVGGARRACPRTLDRPILIFGLEPEDLVAVGLIGGGLLFVTDPLIAVGAAFALWISLLKLKAGRPPGYLFELAYKAGALRVLPRSLRPHILPPTLGLARRTRTLRLSVFGDEHDDE